MKSSKLLAIAFVLLFALPSKATVSPANDTPFVIETAGYVHNHEWLTSGVEAFAVTLGGDLEGTNLNFPEEIPANATWAIATVTDGNVDGTIMALHLPAGNVDALSGIEGFMFRVHLRANTVVAAMFPNGFQMLQRDMFHRTPAFQQTPALFLVSPELAHINLDDLNLENHWWDLRLQTHLGFTQFYPERLLLPTLPPEQEEESDFIKRVRKRSGDAYKEGEYSGTVDSVLVGLRFVGQEIRIVWDQRYVEGTPPTEIMGSSPFPFGGFIDPDAPMNVAFRVPFGKEAIKGAIEESVFGVRGGVRVKPLEEREDDRVYSWQAQPFFTTELKEKDGYHMKRDGNFIVYYPKQLEDHPAEEGILCNAELDKRNVEIARSFFPFLSNVRESLLSIDWSQPIDLVLSIEDSVLYLAFAYPSVGTPIDWNLAIQLVQDVFDQLYQIRPSEDLDMYLDMYLDTLFQTITQEASGTIAGLMCYRLVLTWDEYRYGIVYAHEPGIIYVAIPYQQAGNVATEELFAAVQQRLEEMIEASRRGVAEGMAPPTTVLRVNSDNYRLRADFETTERGHRFTVHIAQESFGNVLALSQQFGVNPLQWLPFW